MTTIPEIYEALDTMDDDDLTAILLRARAQLATNSGDVVAAHNAWIDYDNHIEHVMS